MKRDLWNFWYLFKSSSLRSFRFNLLSTSPPRAFSEAPSLSSSSVTVICWFCVHKVRRCQYCINALSACMHMPYGNWRCISNCKGGASCPLQLLPEVDPLELAAEITMQMDRYHVPDRWCMALWSRTNCSEQSWSRSSIFCRIADLQIFCKFADFFVDAHPVPLL